jgi:GT2 family glycosyltransferase
MSELPSVTVVVLNYNGLEHLQSCFSSLTQLDYPAERLEIMMLDNASKDGSVAYIQAHYPQVHVVQSEQNLGFAGGNNLAAREATGEYVVFLNNDMWVDPHLVRALLAAVQNAPDVVCAGAKILNWDGSRLDFAGSAADFAGHAYQFGLGQPLTRDTFTELQSTLYACGGAMLIARAVFLRVGGFDENHFIYYEDLDLGWRLWVLGYQVVFAPDALVHHRHHGTMSSFSDYRKRLLFKRNSLYTIIKNYSDENLNRMLSATLLATVAGVIRRAERQGQLDTAEFFIKSTQKTSRRTIELDKRNVASLVAIHDVVNHLPELMATRRFIQTHRKRTDQEIADLFHWPFRFWPDVDLRELYPIADAFGIQAMFEDTPRRVLVISSDILPYPGMPTVGSGLRAWSLGQGLISRGHEVIFSMPRAALAKGRKQIAPPEAIDLAWEPTTLANVIKAIDPNVVVVCNWPILDMLPVEKVDVPVILDQHGPHYLEREFQKFGVADDNARRKVNALRKADFFTCAGQKQLAYFQPWLERAGWTESERQDRSAAIPVSLAPDLPERHPDDELSFVYGGVFLPWQDPTLGLSTLVDVLNRRGYGKLYFYGGRHPVYPVDPGIFDRLLADLTQSPQVVAPGMVSHDDLIARYVRSHVAIDVMARNAERELAFTTRTVEYLWCGLPVIYHDYAELSGYIRDYKAGWIVDPDDRTAIAAVINDIFDHPEQVAERSQNAQRLVRELLSWDETIGPLDVAIRHPSVRPGASQARAEASGRAGAGLHTARLLIGEARFHYRRGGIPTLAAESRAFVHRRLSSWLGR